METKYDTHDRWGVEYTPERVKSAARDHVAYGWAKNHRGAYWAPELVAIYDAEYALALKEKKGRK